MRRVRLRLLAALHVLHDRQHTLLLLLRRLLLLLLLLLLRRQLLLPHLSMILLQQQLLLRRVLRKLLDTRAVEGDAVEVIGGGLASLATAGTSGAGASRLALACSSTGPSNRRWWWA